jgi:hypothetical protein
MTGDGFLEDLKDMARIPVRNALFWLGYRDHCPVSILQVVLDMATKSMSRLSRYFLTEL